MNFTDYRLPELYCGYDKRPGEQKHVRYPVACSPQAWAAGAIPHALWNLLGLRANALESKLRILRPTLPEGVDWLEMHNVPVGSARLDLRFTREGPPEDALAVRVDAEVREGDLQVERVDDLVPPEVYT
jgi:hypothetical protein